MPRNARSLDDEQLPPWSFVTFTDLHVAPATIDRALDVLGRVRELAIAHEARILCLGDFWDLRGSLSVRLVDRVLEELNRWQEAGLEAVFIPGNHDQVTTSGRVHGVRIFEGFPNITVTTEPVLWPERKIAFLPWREDPEEQAALFAGIENGWTVFAHAEAAGAISNSGKPMAGRFELGNARAVYLGHFHKRQLIGDRCWYIGSPFEMDMGERADPHGVALITQDELEPAWIDFEDFPKHHRFVYGESWDLKYVRPGDIAEVHGRPEDIGTQEFQQALGTIPTALVKPLALKADVDGGAPEFALQLDEAMDRWVDSMSFGVDRAVKLKLLGRELLKSVPDARAIVPLFPNVKVLSITAHDFCAVRGELHFELPKGEALIRGPMGVGKTSIMDAMTWCFFGRTTPRRAGSHGASLRADDVVHDDADECGVSVLLLCGEHTQVEIVRAKKRGSGAKITITGLKLDAGISDQQEQIHRILGIDHDLWRACVYLGQGAVGTFLTDADKSRKALLSTTFGLNACPAAQKSARARWKQIAVKAEALRRETEGDQKVLESLEQSDFQAEIKAWEVTRADQLSRIKETGEQLSVSSGQIKEHLATESAWLESKQKHETHIGQLTKSLAAAAPRVVVANLQREMGAIDAERAIVQRDLGQAKHELEDHVSGRSANCPTCGKPFDAQTAEQHVEELERKVLGKQRELSTWDAKRSNVATKLEDANNQTGVQTSGIEEEIVQSRGSLAKCAEALNQFSRLKANLADSERRLHDLRADYAKTEQAPNPYLAKQAEKEERVKTLQAKMRADGVELKGVTVEQEDYGFWDSGFGPKGLPVLVLRAALHEIETYANRFLAKLLGGRVFCRLSMEAEDLKILFYEYDGVFPAARERRYEQLSGGQRRCAELAFNPFALSEVIFNRCGVRVSLLVVDELTTHLGQEEKPIICEVLRELDRETIIVIDHDPTVQGAFDTVLDMSRVEGHIQLARAV